ncbi:MAG: hypothetical protein WAO76_11720 [Georgfuchsia sp.]
MNPIAQKLPWGMMLAIVVLLFSLPAVAGNLSFQLSLTGSQLTVINKGDSTAFYPAAFRLLADGKWEQLKTAEAPAELAAGSSLQFIWPDTRPLKQLPALERLQPVMLRFFDQAGVGFGQISFFHSPLAAKYSLTTAYVDGNLQIRPPDDASSIRASWLLWPQEEGIKPIHQPVRFEHHQPPALRIDWQHHSKAPFQLDTGAGEPAAILIHETGQGLALQLVPGGGLQGREQRAAWLDATPKFYVAALIALASGAAALVVQFLQRPRTGTKTGSVKA